MSNKLAWDLKVGVAADIVNGIAFEEIAERHGISLGSVHNISEEYKRGGWPGLEHPGAVIDEVRGHTRHLREVGLTVEQEAVVQRTLTGWIAEGVAFDDLKAVYSAVRGAAHPDEEVVRLLEGAREVRALEEKHGMDIGHILEEGRQSMDLASREKELLERTRAERIEEQRQLASIREERNVIEQGDELKAKRDVHLAEEGEARERRRLALEAAEITEEQLRFFMSFRASVEAEGISLTSPTMRRVARLVQGRREAYVRELTELQDRLVARQWRPPDVESRLDRLQALEALGLDLARWQALTVAFSEYRIDMPQATALLADGVARYGGFQRAVAQRDALIAQYEGEIEQANARARDGLRKEQETMEGINKRQRDADGRLQEAEEHRKDVEEHAHKLAAKNLELRATIAGFYRQLPPLREEVMDLTRQQAEAKARLEKALGVEGEWQDIERALRSARERQRELEAEVQAEQDTLTFAQHLKWTLGGDPRYARTVFAYYAQEPRILTDPNAPGERIVAKAFELLGSQAVRRQEFDQAEQRHKAESEAAAQTLAESKARTEELERKLKDRDRDVDGLSRELASTKQSLEWCREARREASRRTAPAKAPGPSAPRRTP